MQTVEVMKQPILANPHCRRNRGDVPLRVLVVKTPRLTENTKML